MFRCPDRSEDDEAECEDGEHEGRDKQGIAEIFSDAIAQRITEEGCRGEERQRECEG